MSKVVSWLIALAILIGSPIVAAIDALPGVTQTVKQKKAEADRFHQITHIALRS